MNKSMFKIFLYSKSIGFKIMLITYGIFGIFLVLALGFVAVEKYQQRILDKLMNASENESIVQVIDEGVTDIQRNVAIYSTSGSRTVLDKIRQTQTKLQRSLEAIQRNPFDDQQAETIKNFQIILERYKENVNELEKRYNYRKALIDDDMTSLKERGGKTIRELAKSTKNQALRASYNNILIDWYEVFIHAYEFINKKNYALKAEIRNHIADAEKQARTLEGSGLKRSSKLIRNLLSEFNSTFEKAVQANRIYLSLVNVVIAGDAAEFSYLSDSLKEESRINVNELKTTTKQVSKDAVKLVALLMVASFIMLAFIAQFYRTNIINSIKEIAVTFTSYVKGDFSESVPHLERKDEIGNLANAAEAFKAVSEEMKHAKHTAEKLAKSKSEFLANMSHEIRTPMNGILGMAELMSGSDLTQDQKHMLATINSCGESLLTILNDVLDFSKIESGNIQLESRDFCLKDALSEVYYLFENNASEKSIDFDVTIENDDTPHYYKGDITRIKQILINLLSNAIKFTSVGSVKLAVESKAQPDGMHKLTFTVKDTGVGISESASEQLFTAFTQADSSITRKYGGTGLGLTISKQLAELMGGNLSFKSTYRVGTEFYLTLDLKQGAEITRKQLLDTSDAPYAGSDIKALIVEDNVVNIKVAKKYLEKAGISVEIAMNGKVAVELVKEKDFSLIFMDMQMPVMDGVTATRLIRTLPNGAIVPIIAMTANAFDEDKEACYEAGMDEFLSKPVSYKKIINIVGKVLGSSTDESSAA